MGIWLYIVNACKRAFNLPLGALSYCFLLSFIKLLVSTLTPPPDPFSPLKGVMAASTAVLPYSEPQSQALAQTLVSRDEEIARLNRRLSDLTMTTSTVASLAQNDKGAISTASGK